MTGAGTTALQDATRQVADGVQKLTSLTCGPADELEHPADVRNVVASLCLAASRMPPLLGQLAAFLEVENVRGAVAGVAGNDATAEVRAVSDALHRASLDADAMAAALETARVSCEQLTTARPRTLPPHSKRPSRPGSREPG
jgi:hypothetical protein